MNPCIFKRFEAIENMKILEYKVFNVKKGHYANRIKLVYIFIKKNPKHNVKILKHV